MDRAMNHRVLQVKEKNEPILFHNFRREKKLAMLIFLFAKDLSQSLRKKTLVALIVSEVKPTMDVHIYHIPFHTISFLGSAMVECCSRLNAQKLKKMK